MHQYYYLASLAIVSTPVARYLIRMQYVLSLVIRQ